MPSSLWERDLKLKLYSIRRLELNSICLHTLHTLTQDELLIELVHVRRALWDHSIPTSERTKLKKDNLWQEIVNVFGESLTLETIKQRWKHLRDSYVKAKKKMRGYVRSGSGAESGHPL